MIIYGADLSALSLAGTLEWQDFYPLRRDAPSVIYDPVGCRMVMFGGYKDGRNLDDVWTLSMGPQAIWTKLNVATGPAARYLHTAVYDPTGDRMLVFGGFSGVAVDTDFTDVWALGLRANVAWHQILPSRAGPSRGRNRVAVYLQRPDELAILGGSADVGLLDDNWVLQLGDHPAWERISVSGSRPPAGPLCAFYEPARNRIIVGLSDGVYSLWMDNPHWTTVVSQSADWAHSVYDSMRNRLLTYHVPTWHLSLRDSTFGELAMSGPSLSPLSYGSIVDAPNDRAVFYGSQDNSLRTLSWVAAGQETLFARAEVLNGGVPLADSSAFTSLPNFVARIPGVSCLDVALCLVRVDGTDISPPSTAEPQDAIELALPTLSEGEHRLDLRLVSFGVRRVVATATLAFSIIVPQDRLWIGDLHATPNPGHGRIRLGFRLTRPADYMIDFFDLSGRRVARSAGAHGVAGLNSYQWDGTVDGRRAGSGCYLYKVTATYGSAIVTANGRALFLR